MRRFLGEGEADREPAARSGSTLHVDRSSVRGYDGPHEGEPQAHAPGIAAPRRVQPHERVEDARPVGGIDADARVLDFFFFQAEDGIRDLYVTGVQTCALPI